MFQEHGDHIIVYTLNPNLDELKYLIINCNQIDWTLTHTFMRVHEKLQPMLEEVFVVLKLKRVKADKVGKAYFMDKADASKVQYM